MERYITFIRNTLTGEEFVSTRRAGSGAHQMVLAQEADKYPSPKFRVHTTYTEKELSDVLTNVQRMAGSSYLVMADKVNVEGPEAGFKTGVNFN